MPWINPNPQNRVEKIIRKTELLELVKLSRSTIWRLEKQGSFPKRRRISRRLVGWLLSEVEDWIASRPSATPQEMPLPPLEQGSAEEAR